MPQNYTGNAGNATGAGKLTIAEPVDGDADNGATFQTPMQSITDYLEMVAELQNSQILFGWIDRGSITAVQFNDVCWCGGSINLWVAVGASGDIYTSPTGSTWTAQTSNVAQTLNAVAFNGTTIVAVGNGNAGVAPVITTSTTGTSWTSQTSNGTTNTNLTMIAWDPTIALWAATASSGYIVTAATAGGTWTKQTVGVATALNGIASNGAGVFLAVGTDGTNNGWTSTNGTSWTAQVITGLNAQCQTVAYGAGGFVVLDNTSNATKVNKSTNTGGTTWGTASTLVTGRGTLNTLLIGPDLTWTGRVFMEAVSALGGILTYSYDGITWLNRTIPVFPTGSNGATQVTGIGANQSIGQVIAVAASGHAFATPF